MTEPQLRDELEDQMAVAVDKINAVVKEHADHSPPMENIIKISEHIAEVLLESAQNIVTEANNQLEQTKLFIEKLQAEVKMKTEEHVDLATRLKHFGSNVLEAHHRFHGDEPQPSGKPVKNNGKRG